MKSAYVNFSNIISPFGFDTNSNFLSVIDYKASAKVQKFRNLPGEYCLSSISDERLQIACQKEGINTEKHTKSEKLSILSLQEIVSKSGVGLDRSDTLLIVSTTTGNIDISENIYSSAIDKERLRLSRMAEEIGGFFKYANEPVVLSNACISGVLAIVMAERYIKMGFYKHIYICGVDVLSEFVVSGFNCFNALSPNPCKPFDKNRIGINLGESASAMLISDEHISSDSDKIKVLGGASANDANHISGPSRTGEGLTLSVKNALRNSGVQTFDLINAHGTATPYNDEMEAIAFKNCGIEETPVNSLKGCYGHTLGAAGVLESILSIESLKKNVVLGSKGYEECGTSIPLNISSQHREMEISTCLKAASGFGGCNAVAIFRKE